MKGVNIVVKPNFIEIVIIIGVISAATIGIRKIIRDIRICKLGVHKYDIMSGEVKEIKEKSNIRNFISLFLFHQNDYNNDYKTYKVREMCCKCGKKILEWYNGTSWIEDTKYFKELY